MKITSIINLKGGVGKSITAINLAHILTTNHEKKVLLIDNDKQGNSSKFFGVHSYDSGRKTIADMLTDPHINIHDVIQSTAYENLDIISANMNLLKANLQVILDPTRQQQTIFKKLLPQFEKKYDVCIIDNAPDINASIINTIVISDSIIIPVKVDQFAFDGLEQLMEQIDTIKEAFNPNLNLVGCLITQYAKNDVNIDGMQWLRENGKYHVFNTYIRRTERVDASTFASKPILEFSKRCGAAKDYVNFVDELLNFNKAGA